MIDSCHIKLGNVDDEVGKVVDSMIDSNVSILDNNVYKNLININIQTNLI